MLLALRQSGRCCAVDVDGAELGATVEGRPLDAFQSAAQVDGLEALTVIEEVERQICAVEGNLLQSGAACEAIAGVVHVG